MTAAVTLSTTTVTDDGDDGDGQLLLFGGRSAVAGGSVDVDGGRDHREEGQLVPQGLPPGQRHVFLPGRGRLERRW